MTTHNIGVILSGNATSLRSTLIAAGRDVETFEKKVDSAGANTGRSLELLKAGAAAGALAVGAALIYSAGKAAQFEGKMRNVNTISQMSEGALRSLGQEVVNMSRKLPQSANELASGLYDIASSGFQGADGLKVLEASATAASAGLSTTAVSARAITAVLNAYGLSANSAAHVSNVLFQGVNVGVITFEELANTVGDFVGMAAAAHVGIEDATAALATMTLSGVTAAESGTALNRVLQSMINPSADLKEEFLRLGYESGKQALQTDGLVKVFQRLRVASGGNIETLLKWFPEIRSTRGALALMANDGKNLTKSVEAMSKADNGAGAAKAALREQMKGTSAQFKLLVNDVNAGAIAIGTQLLPYLRDGISWFRGFAKEAGALASSVGTRLSPFLSSLGQILSNIFDILGSVGDAVKPFVQGLLAIVGTGVIATLNGIGSVLGHLTGFLANNKAAVAALVTAWAAWKATALAAGFLPMLISYGLKAAESFTLFSQAIAADAFEMAVMSGTGNLLTASMLALAAAEVSVSVAMAGIAGGVALGAGLAIMSLARSADHGKEAAKDFFDSLHIDEGDQQSILAGMNRINAEVQALEATLSGKSGWQRFEQRINPFDANTIDEGVAKVNQLQQEEAALRAEYLKLADGTDHAKDSTDDYTAAVKILASDMSNSADKAQAFKDALDALTTVPMSVFDSLTQVGQATLSLEDAVKDSATQAAQIRQEARDQAQQDAQTIKNDRRAIVGADRDIASATKSRADAVRGVFTAERNLGKLTANSLQLEKDLIQARKDAAQQLVDARDQAEGDKLSVTDAQIALREAEAALAQGPTAADANDPDALLKLQQDVAHAKLALKEANEAAAASTDDLNTKTQQGIDKAPGVVAAQQAIADNTQQIADANQAVVDAKDQVVQADQRIQDAEQAMSDAQAQLATDTEDSVNRQIAAALRLLAVQRQANDFNPFTDQGQKNRQAVSQAIAQAGQLAEAIAKAQGPEAGRKAYVGLLDSIENILEKGGMAKDTVEALFQQLGLMPKDVSVALNVKEGTTQAQLEALIQHERDKAQAALDQTPIILNVKLPKDLPKDFDLNGTKLERMNGLAYILATNLAALAKPKTIYIDGKEFYATADDVNSWVKQYGDSNPTSHALLNTGGAQLGFKKLSEWAEFYNTLDPKTQAELNTDPADVNFLELYAKAAAWREANPSTTVGLDTSDANNKMALLYAQIQANLVALTQLYNAMRPDTSSGSPVPAWPSFPTPIPGQRWGGVEGAHVANRQVFKYAEPETGGEAWIPRRGVPSRSLSILSTAAGWYGHAVVPMAQGGVLTSSPRVQLTGPQQYRLTGPAPTPFQPTAPGHEISVRVTNIKDLEKLVGNTNYVKVGTKATSPTTVARKLDKVLARPGQ